MSPALLSSTRDESLDEKLGFETAFVSTIFE